MLKGWKTILFAVAIGGLGAVQEAELIDVIGQDNAGLMMIVIGAGIAILRKMTNTPVGKAE